jgi:putative membrane protein
MRNNPAIPNVDSTARDHLANERTFLAWVRTALGFIGLGVVVAKLVEGKELLVEVTGFALVIYGAIVLIYAIVRYERVAGLLQRGEFRVAKQGPWILGLVALLVALGAVIVLMFALP